MSHIHHRHRPHECQQTDDDGLGQQTAAQTGRRCAQHFLRVDAADAQRCLGQGEVHEVDGGYHHDQQREADEQIDGTSADRLDVGRILAEVFREMGIGNRRQHHLQGFLLLRGCHVEVIFEQLDGLLAHGGNHIRQVGYIVHTDIRLIVPVMVVAFVFISASETDAVQEVVFRIVFYHGTHIEDPTLHPFVFQGLAHRIGSAKDAHGF